MGVWALFDPKLSAGWCDAVYKETLVKTHDFNLEMNTRQRVMIRRTYSEKLIDVSCKRLFLFWLASLSSMVLRIASIQLKEEEPLTFKFISESEQIYIGR